MLLTIAILRRPKLDRRKMDRKHDVHDVNMDRHHGPTPWTDGGTVRGGRRGAEGEPPPPLHRPPYDLQVTDGAQRANLPFPYIGHLTTRLTRPMDTCDACEATRIRAQNMPLHADTANTPRANDVACEGVQRSGGMARSCLKTVPRRRHQSLHLGTS